LPSMTALSILRHRKNPPGLPPRELLVFADPVFEADDPRIGRNDSGNSARSTQAGRVQSASPTRTSSKVGLQFPRLPGTRHEAEEIASVASADGTEVLLGFDASRQRATSHEIEEYRFIHFATHSVIDDAHPESSAVILSLFDRAGRRQDGFLRLREIYNLKLSADLVVLSACDSALGKDIKGEGIVGLTRGFMYAGTQRVLATLWEVDDEATSELMKWFYVGMLQKHNTPALSLREAQMEVRQQERWKSPFYWGAFVIEGDWRPGSEAPLRR